MRTFLIASATLLSLVSGSVLAAEPFNAPNHNVYGVSAAPATDAGSAKSATGSQP